MLTTNIILIIIFYLIGSLPFALILTKLSGFGDIRNIGSGNVGATNVLRTGNKFLALIVLFLDIIKGFVPFLILQLYFDDLSLLNKILVCHFSIIGHIFPIWLKFKGGKGVATYLGIIIALSFEFGIIFCIVWLLTSFIFRYSSLASMVGGLVVFTYSIILDNATLSIFLFIIFIIILYTHRDNIVRLKDSKETKIKL